MTTALRESGVPVYAPLPEHLRGMRAGSTRVGDGPVEEQADDDAGADAALDADGRASHSPGYGANAAMPPPLFMPVQPDASAHARTAWRPGRSTWFIGLLIAISLVLLWTAWRW